jgi:hypothetical protein
VKKIRRIKIKKITDSGFISGFLIPPRIERAPSLCPRTFGSTGNPRVPGQNRKLRLGIRKLNLLVVVVNYIRVLLRPAHHFN